MKLAVKRAKLWAAPSDGSHHTSPEAVIAYERDLLIARVAELPVNTLRELFVPHQLDPDGELLVNLRADILEFASLLRPPRAKRGSKMAAGQSAANPPSHASSMEPSAASFAENRGSALGTRDVLEPLIDDEPMQPERASTEFFAGSRRR